MPIVGSGRPVGRSDRARARFFDLRNPRMEVFAEDARPWLERSAGGYDAIIVDAYRQWLVDYSLLEYANE